MNRDVYPCPFLYDEKHKMRNLLNNDFDEVWSSGVEELKHTKISSEEISDGRKYSLLFRYVKVEVSC